MRNRWDKPEVDSKQHFKLHDATTEYSVEYVEEIIEAGKRKRKYIINKPTGVVDCYYASPNDSLRFLKDRIFNRIIKPLNAKLFFK